MVPGLIYRQRGRIQESLTLFQSATCLNPQNVANLKQVSTSWSNFRRYKTILVEQVAHSLYLMGRHRQAIDVYEEARKLTQESSSKKPVNSWELCVSGVMRSHVVVELTVWTGLNG